MIFMIEVEFTRKITNIIASNISEVNILAYQKYYDLQINISYDNIYML
jgi:hypothetical protein